MAKICYQTKNFRESTLMILDDADDIISGMQAQGFTLTVRQIYYQFIAKDLFPSSWIDPVYNAKNGLAPDTKNTEKNYKRLGSILTDGRLAGVIDWEAIEDRTRSDIERTHWNSPADILRAAARGYTIDLWNDQEIVPEVWIEKEALSGVFEPTCKDEDVLLFPCRGYSSISAMWNAAMRIRARYEDNGQRTTILHFGDHDPSGMDMTNDIEKRLNIFLPNGGVEVHRIALNMAQVKKYNPPSNPAKISDSRAKKYVAQYGKVSWELDALDAPTLAALVRKEVKALRDEPDLYQERLEEELDGQNALTTVADGWKD